MILEKVLSFPKSGAKCMGTPELDNAGINGKQKCRLRSQTAQVYAGALVRYKLNHDRQAT